MKKAVYTTFVAFWSCVVTIAAIDALTPAAEAQDSKPSLATYTLAEVTEHDHLDDCWMAIEGQVYDFTGYIDQHPTPPSVLASWCGRNATEGMRTKSYGGSHSSRAWALMDEYLIGTLSEG